MKLKKDTITGIVGLLASIFFLVMIQNIRQPAKLLEPGPRLMPYVGVALIAISSIALIIKGIKESASPDKPYFPKGGVKKLTISYLILVLYAIAMSFLGFLVTTPFATFVLIYDLKGNTKVKPLTAALISILVTAGLYLMFVYGFQVKLPVGSLFR